MARRESALGGLCGEENTPRNIKTIPTTAPTSSTSDFVRSLPNSFRAAVFVVWDGARLYWNAALIFSQGVSDAFGAGAGSSAFSLRSISRLSSGSFLSGIFRLLS